MPTEVKIEDVLAERGKRYGQFEQHADITQALKKIMSGYAGSVALSKQSVERVVSRVEQMQPDQIECLEMIAHKIGRILNGDPNYEDSWRDIAGYTTLVANRLVAEEVAKLSAGTTN